MKVNDIIDMGYYCNKDNNRSMMTINKCWSDISVSNFMQYPYGMNEDEANENSIMKGISFPLMNEIYNINRIRTFAPKKIPIKTLKDNLYVYVNCKQYAQIVKRREKRINIIKLNKENIAINVRDKNKNTIITTTHSNSIITKGKRYHHESRHRHAMNRQRGSGGRFLSKQISSLEDTMNSHITNDNISKGYNTDSNNHINNNQNNHL